MLLMIAPRPGSCRRDEETRSRRSQCQLDRKSPHRRTRRGSQPELLSIRRLLQAPFSALLPSRQVPRGWDSANTWAMKKLIMLDKTRPDHYSKSKQKSIKKYSCESSSLLLMCTGRRDRKMEKEVGREDRCTESGCGFEHSRQSLCG